MYSHVRYCSACVFAMKFEAYGEIEYTSSSGQSALGKVGTYGCINPDYSVRFEAPKMLGVDGSRGLGIFIISRILPRIYLNSSHL